MTPVPMPPPIDVSAVYQAVNDALPPLFALIAISGGIALGLKFGYRVVQAVMIVLEPSGFVTGDEKPKNEDKPKNDDRVGFDPYAETDEPAYTIGDDGELVEVKRG